MKAQLLPPEHDKAFHSIIRAENLACIWTECWDSLFKHQRHGIPIIMQQCQQSLFINSICYLSSPACCAGEKKKTEWVDWELNFWWLTCSLRDSWGKRETNNSSNFKKASVWYVRASGMMANYDILYATSVIGSNSGMLIEKINNGVSARNNDIYHSRTFW